MRAGDEFVSERRELTDPGTGRRLIQLTAGDAFDYPLYYFIPSMTRDGDSVIFHRHQDGEVQMYRLNLKDGRTVRLTDATTPNALWRPWLQEPARGVRDLMSAFSPETDELVYFDSNDIRAVHVRTLEDRKIHHLPDDRVPCGLTGVSPDGRWFVWPHADRKWWEMNLGRGPERHTARDVHLDVLDLRTGDRRTLLHFNGWITHSSFYENSTYPRLEGEGF